MHSRPGHDTLLAVSGRRASAGRERRRVAGDDRSREAALAQATAKREAPAAPASGDVPTYAQVKALALKDPKVAKLCADGGEDRKIGDLGRRARPTRA